MTASRSRLGLWLPGLVVAAGAAVATAHGLYEVARAAGTPTPIAALYPLICDGLALVAYGATTRLDTPSNRAYAWTIVVLAAGLSGLAQAAYLAGDGVHQVPTWLRFGIGAWPATAAAIVAHLLYLLGTSTESDAPSNAVSNLSNEVSSLSNALDSCANRPSNGTDPLDGDDLPGGLAPARDRARAVAEVHRDRHGDLPSINQLAALADVARGTAAAALKELCDAPAHPRNESDR